MSSETYAIVFNGDVIDGHEPAKVQAQLASLLKLDPEKVKALFSGKRIILKRTRDKAEAVKYGKALKRIGADVKVKVTQAETSIDSDTLASKLDVTDQAPAKPENATANRTDSTTDSSTITLAPNVGDLFDLMPEAPVPDLDLSEYTLAENDGSFIVDPVKVVEVELDLSTYTVADNDGSDLFEPKEAMTSDIRVPDFGLAEPGALLETLQEGKGIQSPDTKGMTLAVAGLDLLEEDGKRPKQAPRIPDTSGINLVPNFDN